MGSEMCIRDRLRTDQTITIEEINGITLKQPMTIVANKSFNVSRESRLKVKSFKVNVLTANTNLKLFVSCAGRK